jgi:Tfp pilus assembly protein PilZ
MSTLENEQLQSQERAAADTDGALAATEISLAQRGQVVETEPPAARVQALLSRIAAMQTAGVQSADLTKAANVLKAALSPDPALALAERTAALSARKTALQAREAAVKGLTAALTQAETAKATHRRNLASVETFLSTAEGNRTATAAAQPPAPAPAPVAAKPASIPPPARPTAPAPAPGTPMTTPQSRMQPAPTNARSAPEMTANTARKLSRRRRVRLAPPPKKLEVEVASFGDNTFYTGFDNKISSGGLFVATLETLPAGHELDLLIDLEGKQIKTKGKVEFVRVDNTSNPECTPGAGIKLLSLSAGDAAVIEGFFNSRPPMFLATAN